MLFLLLIAKKLVAASGRLLPVTTVCLTVVGTNQRIETTFLSRLSLIADIERLPVAAC